MEKDSSTEWTALAGRDFSGEWTITASRSRGPGGQHVNKVSTKVELRFHLPSSRLLTDAEKEMLAEKLRNKLTGEGFLVVTAQAERSQLKNKLAAAEKFHRIMNRALTTGKTRKPTRRTLQSAEKRLAGKKIRADKKVLRKKPEW